MKKITNQVPVSTLLSTMSPKSFVKIVDLDSLSKLSYIDPLSEDVGNVYTVRELTTDLTYTRIAHAAIRKTVVDDNMLILVICTLQEDY